MDDNGQNGLQAEQWLPAFQKGEKRTNSLGSGALRFIRTRSSIRRELKRQCNRNKNGDSHMVHDNNNSSGGGGLGKWIRDHLGGGSRTSHDVSTATFKANGSGADGTGNEKSFGKTIYTSQNLYCSLPREHGRHSYNGGRKTGHGNPPKSQGHDRQRSSSVNHQEKSTLSDLGTLTRGGPIYSSDGKTLKKRNRDRRRHSLNETHEQGRQRRRSVYEEQLNDHGPGVYARLEREDHLRSSRSTACGSRPSRGGDDPTTITYDQDRASFGGESGEERPYEFEYKENEIDEEEDKRVEHLMQEESIWDTAYGKRIYRDEKYKDPYDEEEEVGEGEEEIPLSPTASGTEKLEEEVRQVEESDHVLAEIPAEILADREALIGRLKESLAEQAELRRKNKLLELWVFRHLKKIEEKITPADVSKDADQMEEIYREALCRYKVQIDEIMTQQASLMFEVQSYTNKVRTLQEQDERVFNEFLTYEREIALDLVYAKTGRKMTEKIINEMIHRQKSRREILTRDRRNYILHQHRLEELHAGLRNLETLGEGMTTMDYEALRITNISYKDKLDERDQELEKLRLKIAEVVNGVAHYKEKEACLTEDIEYEEESLKEFREKTSHIREQVNRLHLTLKDLRETYNGKKLDAGLLIAQQELREMDRTMKLRDALKKDIEIIENDIQQYPSSSGKKKRNKLCRRSTMIYDKNDPADEHEF